MDISHLLASEIPPGPAPTERWFQKSIKQHPTLFRTIKPKSIARVRVSALDVTLVEDWFKKYTAWCTQHSIEPQNIHNFDETGFRPSPLPLRAGEVRRGREDAPGDADAAGEGVWKGAPFYADEQDQPRAHIKWQG